MSEIKSRVWEYTVRDQSWQLDWWELDVTEVIEIRKATGYRYPELVLEHEAGDFLAARAIVWICRRRAGETGLAFDEVRFTLREFRRSLVTQTPAEDEATPDPRDAAPDPAPPDSTGR